MADVSKKQFGTPVIGAIVAGGASGFTITGGAKTLTVDETVSMSGKMNVGGTEKLYAYSYTHAITAAEKLASAANITIGTVTRSKVRSLNVVLYDGTDAIGSLAAYIASYYTSSATNIVVTLGASALEGHVLSVLITVAE